MVMFPSRGVPGIPCWARLSQNLDHLLVGADAKTAFDQNGLLDQLRNELMGSVLKEELDLMIRAAILQRLRPQDGEDRW